MAYPSGIFIVFSLMVGKYDLIVRVLPMARSIMLTVVHMAARLSGSAMCLTWPVWTRCLPVYGQIKSRDRRSVQVVTPYDPGFPSFAYDLPPCGSLYCTLVFRISTPHASPHAKRNRMGVLQ